MASFGTLSTPVGLIGVLSDGAAIARVTWQPVPPDGADGEPDPLIDEALAQLGAYFDGRLREFDLPVDLGVQTTATRAVLTALYETVRHGETITYGGLAGRSGTEIPARGIGAIMGANPVPLLVPCHRVVAGDGLGGYSGGDPGQGLAAKRWLLEHEGGAAGGTVLAQVARGTPEGPASFVGTTSGVLREWRRRVPSRGADVQFISTRGSMQPQSFSETLLEGLAPDGGLAVPEEMPVVDGETLERWRALTYPQLAAEVLGLFATDIPRADLARMTAAAYADFPEGVVPLRAIDDDITLVGLSEGPTLAFKDMAMQFLGQVLEYTLEHRGAVLNVLGATSGDTGSAAEHALRGKERVSVFMLSPQGRMSAFQRAQMFSIDDDNVHNIVVDGVFDDCQNLVKRLAGDLDFKRAQSLGAVNSINLARITAQVVYYFWAWLRATDAGGWTELSFTVPSGNFGNILSGFFARQMGLPIRRLVLAANENNVLDEFFRTGIYRPRSAAQTLATSSPSMDISKASNLERFIFELVGRDASRVVGAWRELDEQGFFDVAADQPRFVEEFGIVSGTSIHADRLDTIRAVYEGTGEVIDPHTADGVKVAREYVEPGVPMLVLETAKPQKFAETIREAIGIEVELSPALQQMLDAPQHLTEMADDERALRAFIEAHALSS